MGAYLTTQIIEKRLTYGAVVAKFPKYRTEIDKILVERGYVIDKKGEVAKKEVK